MLMHEYRQVFTPLRLLVVSIVLALMIGFIGLRAGVAVRYLNDDMSLVNLTGLRQEIASFNEDPNLSTIVQGKWNDFLVAYSVFYNALDNLWDPFNEARDRYLTFATNFNIIHFDFSKSDHQILSTALVDLERLFVSAASGLDLRRRELNAVVYPANPNHHIRTILERGHALTLTPMQKIELDSVAEDLGIFWIHADYLRHRMEVASGRVNTSLSHFDALQTAYIVHNNLDPFYFSPSSNFAVDHILNIAFIVIAILTLAFIFLLVFHDIDKGTEAQTIIIRGR
ncbi:MAG: hypothetical protein FWE31_04195, partial [Firmicutes bacterium]|nr:hypothetical protein [Bacillota bacterium]